MNETQTITMPQPNHRDREATITKIRRLADMLIERGDCKTETMAKIAILLARESQGERVRRNRANRLRRKRRKLLGNATKAMLRKNAVSLRDFLARPVQ